MTKNKNIAIVYAGWDGVLGCFTGIGVLTQDFIKSFPAVSKHFQTLDTNLALHVLALNVSKTSSGYSYYIGTQTKSVCRSSGGDLHMINAKFLRDSQSSAYNFWERVSKESARIVSEISDKYDQVIVYLTNLPYLGTPYYFNQITPPPNNIKFVLVPPPPSYHYFITPNKSEKQQWEAWCYQLIDQLDDTFIAETSKNQINSFKAVYELPNSKVVPLQTGLFMDDERFEPVSREMQIQAMQEYGIPIDTDLIFSVGRASPSKGFEELIQTFVQLIKIHTRPIHLVMIISPDQQFEGSTQTINQVKQLVSDNKLEDNCTPIYQLDMTLRRYVYQWEKTKIVAMLSLEESFGLVPEEARISPNKKGPIVVASNIGGHKEQLTTGKDGFLVDPHNHLRTAKTMSKILNMPEPELSKIRKAGLVRAKKDYDYTKNVIESLNIIVKA